MLASLFSLFTTLVSVTGCYTEDDTNIGNSTGGGLGLTTLACSDY